MGLKFFSWFKRKKKKKEVGVFGQPIKKLEKKLNQNSNSFTAYIKGGARSFKQRITPQRKIRIKYLLKVKRFFAGALCIIYLFSFLSTIPTMMSILFFLTFFFLLDYIWKTRLMKWVTEEKEP